jgi:predicted extracellular nuclease
MKKMPDIERGNMPRSFFHGAWIFVLWWALQNVCVAQNPILPIGLLRGMPSSDTDAFDVEPFYKGKSVRIQGVIHQRILWKGARSGKPNHAFLIQNSLADSDRQSNTSDGLFVFTGKESIPRHDGGSHYLPSVGDYVQLQGVVGHRYGQTELTKPSLLKVLRRHVDVSSMLPRVELDSMLDQERKRSKRSYENLEGMRVTLKAGAVVQSGRQFVGQGQDALFWVLPSGHPVAQRKALFHNRTFRDAHPLDDLPDSRFDNDNGARILLSSLGLKGHSQKLSLNLPRVRTGDEITRALTGGIVYSYSQYKFMPMELPSVQQGAHPDNNMVKEPAGLGRGKGRFRVVTYNVENLYDHRDDPADPCDAPDNPGTSKVRPPFNYLPRGESEYRSRLKVFASQIIHDMGEPELLLLQEVEDQDMISFSEGFPSREMRQPDGYPDVLQELAHTIHLQGGAHYRGVLNRFGADERGISCAFFYRLDCVKLLEMGNVHRWVDVVKEAFPQMETFGDARRVQSLAIQANIPGTKQTIEKVYARPSQLARFEFNESAQKNRADNAELYVLNNHFASRPQERVVLRRNQATLASVVSTALGKTYPDSYVMVAGDLNVYPRPDDPYPDRPSDQLRSLYDTGLLSVYDWVLGRQPANAYSYVYEGQAQTLDHCFLSENLHRAMYHAHFLHINADWSQFSANTQLEITTRGVSDHDPLIMTFGF